MRKKIFPNYCDGDWTQEQSDTVYLGQGIEMFALDDETPINRIIYYPVILNGVIVDRVSGVRVRGIRKLLCRVRLI